MSRPLAKWKVEYDAEVAAMTNADLLAEVITCAEASGEHDGPDPDAMYCFMTSDAELTRRLTAIGFLPSTDIAHGT